MCPVVNFEEGSELVIDRESPTLTTGWSETAGLSGVVRSGSLVTVAIRATNAARAAWKEKEKYTLGTLTTEGGKTYVLIKLEEAAEKEKPTSNPTFWKEVVNPATICTLPGHFRPGAAIKNAAGTLEVKANGEVVALDSIAAEAAKIYEANYVAGNIVP